MSDLLGARLKVERAKHHIADLSVEKTSFLATDPYCTTPEYYPEHDFTVYYLDKFTAVPARIALIAGDAAHNLRSALDLLASTLVGRGPGRNKRGHTYFPIRETAAKYQADAPGMVEGMLPSDIQRIDGFKPYGGGNDQLWGLHRLDIIDKHCLLPTPVIAVNRIGIQLSTEFVERAFLGHIRFSDPDAIPKQTRWYDIPNALSASKQGDPVLSVKGNREHHQDVEVTFDIALGEPDVFKGKPILATLEELAALVSDIAESFDLSS